MVSNYSELVAAEAAFAVIEATGTTGQVDVTLGGGEDGEDSEGETESVTIDGVTYEVDKQTAGVMTQIKGIVLD